MGKRYSKSIDQSTNDRLYEESPVVVFEETVGFAAFSDGGGATGTYTLKVDSIPAQATVLAVAVVDIVGFANDSTATIQIGDGSDVDRYSTGTPSVFTTDTDGVDVGKVSGVQYHVAAKDVVLTVTGGADFTSINAGQVTVRVYYLL